MAAAIIAASSMSGNDYDPCDATHHDGSAFNAYMCDHRWAEGLFVTGMVLGWPIGVYLLVLFFAGTKLGKFIWKWFVGPILMVVVAICYVVFCGVFFIIVTLVYLIICVASCRGAAIKDLLNIYPKAFANALRQIGHMFAELWAWIGRFYTRYAPWIPLQNRIKRKRQEERRRLQAILDEKQARIDLEANALPPKGNFDKPPDYELTEITPPLPTAASGPVLIDMAPKKARRDSPPSSPPMSPAAETDVQYEAVTVRLRSEHERVMALDQFHFIHAAEAEAERQRELARQAAEDHERMLLYDSADNSVLYRPYFPWRTKKDAKLDDNPLGDRLKTLRGKSYWALTMEEKVELYELTGCSRTSALMGRSSPSERKSALEARETNQRASATKRASDGSKSAKPASAGSSTSSRKRAPTIEPDIGPQPLPDPPFNPSPSRETLKPDETAGGEMGEPSWSVGPPRETPAKLPGSLVDWEAAKGNKAEEVNHRSAKGNKAEEVNHRSAKGEGGSTDGSTKEDAAESMVKEANNESEGESSTAAPEKKEEEAKPKADQS